MLLDEPDIAKLRQALTAARYDRASITDRLGKPTMASIARGDYRAALAATTGGDPQATLIRLFMCTSVEPAAAVRDALAPLPDDVALKSGLIVADTDTDRYRAGLALECHGAHWVLSDLPAHLGGTITADHVLGVGGASRSLAEYMIRRPVDSAVDIGTGCGVQALDLSGHARRVTATDLLPRAVAFAGVNASLNGLDWDLLSGDMLAPLAGRRFDQVVCNPPFIVGPGVTDYTYRDSGRAGDGVCAELARSAPQILNPGGTLQFLANWVHVAGQDWRDRVAGWFDGTGCDAWAIQRDTTDPLDYVRIWQRDSGADHDPQRLAEWLEWFDANNITAIGFGVINMRHSGSSQPDVLCEDFRHRPPAPFGTLVAERFDAISRLDALGFEGLLDAPLRLRDGVQLQQQAGLTTEGWDVQQQLLVDSAGTGRRQDIDPLLVSLLGGCTGVVPLRTQIGLLAQAHEAPEALLAASLLPVVARLIRDGFLIAP
jgi:hypothetical protein